jgi:hypothetical protein
MHRDLFGRLLAEQGDATVFTPITLPAPTPEPVPVVPVADHGPALDAFASLVGPWRKSRWPQFGANGARRSVDLFLRSVGR